MANLLDLIITRGGGEVSEPALRRDVAAHVEALRASAGRGARRWVHAAEEHVRAAADIAFSFDGGGYATLSAAGQTWSAGRFETPTLDELLRRAKSVRNAAQSGSTGRLRLWVLDGASPATDIGGLQATSGEGALFQVASQFNCLESPGPNVSPVANYFGDSTQGPRASISAFPATLLRHYAAPSRDGGRFVQQTGGPQIDLLADVFGRPACHNGYFTGQGVGDPVRIVRLLLDRFGEIRIGVHDRAEVVLGYDWDGAVETSPPPLIAQVFTSTVAGGMYGGERALGGVHFTSTCRELLRAAYLGTLLAAVSLKRRRVVLTLIGGGVFGNPIPLILESIKWAIEQVEPLLASDLEVVVNGYNLGSAVDLHADVLPLVRRHLGVIARFHHEGLAEVLR